MESISKSLILSTAASPSFVSTATTVEASILFTDDGGGDFGMTVFPSEDLDAFPLDDFGVEAPSVEDG